MKRLLYLLIVLLPSCREYQQCNLEMKVKAIEMNLFLDEVASSAAPPQLYFTFSVLELNNNIETYFLSERGSRPKAFIVDTLKNQVIPIILASRGPEVNSSDTSYFFGYVNIYDHGNYYGVDSSYFSQLEFLNGKDFLRKKSIEMLNNSILIYMDESSSSLEDSDASRAINTCIKSVIISKPIYKISDINVFQPKSVRQNRNNVKRYLVFAYL